MTSGVMIRVLVAVAVAVLFGAGVRAEQGGQEAGEAYFSVPLRDLKITEGVLPTEYPRDAFQTGSFLMREDHPYAVLDGPGEVYVPWNHEQLATGSVDHTSPYSRMLVVRAPAGAEVRGRLYVPNSDFSGMQEVCFVIAGETASPTAVRAFHEGRHEHYMRLQGRYPVGRAWFRHCADESLRALGRGGSAQARNDMWRLERDMQGTFALMTGGRAISENLALDRVVAVARHAAPGEAMIAVESLKGITVAEMDFAALLGDSTPALDGLAAVIPADQHAVFFPSFEALATVAAELDGGWLSLTELRAPRTERVGVVERYERQLCASTRGLAALLGPQLVRSVALTGSDPYFPTGTDVAVLFETGDPGALRSALLGQIAAGMQGTGVQAEVVDGEVDGVAYRGAASADRTVSAYVAVVGDVVVLTNSTVQLGRIITVQRGSAPPLAGLAEYRFFRTRYPLGDAGESAMLFVSDATIRRWCGPRWRIGASRRARAAAVMAEATAQYLDELAAGWDVGRQETFEMGEEAGLGAVTVTARGVRSAVYNTPAFLTPIAELDLDQVSGAEAQGYEQWRAGYEQMWRWAFDPIAVRVGVEPGRLTGDVSVMPLRWGSQYRTWVDLTRGASFGARGGDPHETLWQGVIALNRSSAGVQMGAGWLAAMAPGLAMDPLGWMGTAVTAYADLDPMWAELAAAGPEGAQQVLESKGYALPVALRIESASTMKLAAFVAGVRAFLDQSTPGIWSWEPGTHAGLGYVKVSVLEAAQTGERFDDVVIYYAATPSALTVTPNEGVLKRALEREGAAREALAQGKEPEGDAWLGTNVAIRVHESVWGLLPGTGVGRDAIERASWTNLPILNEWKRRFPERDPVEVHQAYWGVTPVCPAGGRYVWNPKWRTMESTVMGHPAEPRADAELPRLTREMRRASVGLTFEHDGVRARAELERTPRSGED